MFCKYFVNSYSVFKSLRRGALEKPITVTERAAGNISGNKPAPLNFRVPNSNTRNSMRLLELLVADDERQKPFPQPESRRYSIRRNRVDIKIRCRTCMPNIRRAPGHIPPGPGAFCPLVTPITFSLLQSAIRMLVNGAYVQRVQNPPVNWGGRRCFPPRLRCLYGLA